MGQIGDEIVRQADALMTANATIVTMRRERSVPQREQPQAHLDLRYREPEPGRGAGGGDLHRRRGQHERQHPVHRRGVALVLLVSGLLLTRAIGAPLRAMAAIMDAIAGGETSREVPNQDRGDEIGRIALETLRAVTGPRLRPEPDAGADGDRRDDRRPPQ